MTCKMSNIEYAEKLTKALSEESKANAARLTQAMTAVFTGSPSTSTMVGNMGLGVTFAGNDKQNLNLCRRQAALRYCQLYIVLDVENPFGMPVRFDFIYTDAHCAIQFQDCEIWSPDRGDGTMIAIDGNKSGFFHFQPGLPLEFHQGKLPGSVKAGNRRAMDRFYQNLATLPAPKMQHFALSVTG